jgi:putative ATP-binding cassette transporter
VRPDAGGGAARRAVPAILGAGFVAGAASTGLLVLISAALDRAGGAPAALGWTFLGLCLLLPVARFASQALLVRLTQGVSYDLRLRLSGRILASPLRRLEAVGPARLLATLTDDIQVITAALANVPLLVLHLTVVAGCLVFMGWLSWPLLLAVLAAVGLGVVSYRLPVAVALRHFRAGRDQWDRVVGHFRGLTDGVKELKMHRPRRRAFLARLLEPAAGALRRHHVRGGVVYAAANSFGQVLFFLLIGLILFVLPEVASVERRVATGYTLAILYLLTPLDVLLNMLPNLGRAVVAVDKVAGLGLSLERTAEDEGHAAVAGAPAAWRRLELAGVTHTFRGEDADDAFTLGPVDLALRPGELVFLIGGNGSGKTTLAKLLLGLYPPESGEVRLDGEAVTAANRDRYRQLFSAVFSDCFLFEALLGLEAGGLGPGGLDEAARRHLARLHLDRKVRIAGGTLSTLELSQGQRKRLAMLTAYLEDRPIYLFDEWAADQDPMFKEIFYRQLVPDLRRRGKTILLITHDDRYYPAADRLVKLDSGRVVYDGPPGRETAARALHAVPRAAAAAAATSDLEQETLG